MDADVDDVDDEVQTELERVVRRWQQLPLGRALPAVPGVSALVQDLADGVSDATGTPRATVPDLGPAVLMDQLRVMVHDWQGAGLSPQDLGRRLTALRRTLP
ncbi:hypothetical protein ACQE98_02660 [Ornithinimicrobium sp. W1679]|uniref:hypothetical protein n=1 Tax=unclassified Ornithinimicrobium TaxID=2615080 RepID=UPI003CF6D413